jgi:alpha-tubulin suppressor-like RCC1 family protein
MSEVRVNNIVDYGGKGAPTFDNGAVISGVSSLGNQAKIGSNVTITSGGINVSGVTTAVTLSGNLTGDVNSGFVTATSAVIGSGVTINAGGINITGVVTATTFEGSGASMTGVAMTITPLAYNPDVNSGGEEPTTGIGITFDHRILAGSGNVTLSIATNAGAAGTVVENFGVGSSVTIQGRKVIIDPTSDLDASETYHISYPSGAFTNTSGDVSYVGTAYTFGTRTLNKEMWGSGNAQYGSLGDYVPATNVSSPIQIPGNNWVRASKGVGHTLASKTDGTLWATGLNQNGALGNNSTTYQSSPIQIPGTTWETGKGKFSSGRSHNLAIKTDGTLWAWGANNLGQLGLNYTSSPAYHGRSSPVQIPGTTWSHVGSMSYDQSVAIKTDGTLWCMGENNQGQLGQNNQVNYSSPVQIPGTTWSIASHGDTTAAAIKTDGTLWAWGYNNNGNLGQNNRTTYSSPVQVPGTTWNHLVSYEQNLMATKTDGTLWMVGENLYGQLGQNEAGPSAKYSSPVQIPGTTWASGELSCFQRSATAIKTDGTMWHWGGNSNGIAGLNVPETTRYSSPVQVPGTNWSWLSWGDQQPGAFEIFGKSV